MKEKTFKKGDRVKWVGVGNGSRVSHEGVVMRGFHKITGKPRKARLYRVRTSLLTLVKR